MNINYEYYKIFYNVAKNKNITKTANELLISQPAISKSIKNLETQLSCTLFTRNKSGVLLTEEGKVLFEEIKNAIEIMDNAENKIDEMINLESGTLNIGINNTLTQKYLLTFIKQFTNRYPKIKIKIMTGPPLELITKARNGLVDLIILNLPYEVPNDFSKQELITIQDTFVASHDFKELENKTLTLEELNDYPLILLAKGSNGRYFLDNLAEEQNVKLNPKFELASYSLVTEFVKSGIGIGLLTKEFVQNELETNQLFEIKTNINIKKRNIGVIYLKNKSLNRCSKEFLKLITNKNQSK